jgi:predicted nucleic acid-binding protein
MIAIYLEDVVLQNMDIIPYDDRAAEWHAEQRAKLYTQGKTPSFESPDFFSLRFTRIGDFRGMHS